MEEVKRDEHWLDEPVEEKDTLDPFSQEYAPGLSLIVLMRIYDVQLAIYRSMNKEAADKLLALHQDGKILGPLPDIDL